MILFNISGCRRKNSWFSRKIYFQTLFIFRYTPTAPISRLLTWCKSAPLFSNCPDFLQIEIYYNKRKFFGAFLFKERISLLKKKISFLCKEENLHDLELSQKLQLERYFLSRSELSLAFTSGKLSRELLVEEHP